MSSTGTNGFQKQRPNYIPNAVDTVNNHEEKYKGTGYIMISIYLF